MITKLFAVIRSLHQNGFLYTFQQIIIRILSFPSACVFVVYDKLNSHGDGEITIIIRGSAPESDTYSLADELTSEIDIQTLNILSYHQVETDQLRLWDDKAVNISTSLISTPSCIRAVSRSRIVICKGDSNVKWYRILDTSSRCYVRLYHGPITKANGRTKQSSDPKFFKRWKTLLDTSPYYRSVGSDVEKYFRSSSEDRHPDRFYDWGYPRFDRIQRFVRGDADPVLPPETRELLECGSQTNVLYAPTHKDGAFTTTFFPFPDVNVDTLHQWCRDNEVRIFLRPHPSEDVEINHLIDNEYIYYADQSFANSATELMPYIDCLITDYSSIYIEYLPFDRPIVFVKDNHKQFEQVRGLAFDYDKYFPGPKPETFDEFLDSLTSATTNEDGYARERDFVREAYVPGGEESFLNAALSEL